MAQGNTKEGTHGLVPSIDYEVDRAALLVVISVDLRAYRKTFVAIANVILGCEEFH
jgi:hypothetical protein